MAWPVGPYARSKDMKQNVCLSAIHVVDISRETQIIANIKWEAPLRDLAMGQRKRKQRRDFSFENQVA